jgi:hypothetical protein
LLCEVKQFQPISVLVTKAEQPISAKFISTCSASLFRCVLFRVYWNVTFGDNFQ